MRGNSGAWDWDFRQEIGNNRLKYFTHNPLNATLGAANSTRFYNGRLEFTQAVTNLDPKASPDSGLPAPVKPATCAEFRADRQRIGAGVPDSYRSGGIAIRDGPATGAVATVGAQNFGGISPRDVRNVQRHSTPLYVDAETDLARSFRVSPAARLEAHISPFLRTEKGHLLGASLSEKGGHRGADPHDELEKFGPNGRRVGGAESRTQGPVWGWCGGTTLVRGRSP